MAGETGGFDNTKIISDFATLCNPFISNILDKCQKPTGQLQTTAIESPL
jgi:hypothetical protein